MSGSYSFPPFEALPLTKDGPMGNAWGRFGPSDQLGMLNLLTPEVVTEAAKEIRTGVRVSLDWPLNKPSYPSFGRNPFEQKLVSKAPRSVNDDILCFNSQCSSQWDGFRHYGFQKEKLFYGGVTQDEIEITGRIGIDVVAEHGGIVGRGVLIDYAEWAEKNRIKISPFESTPITLEHLRTIVSEHELDLRPGDILFVRSGFTAAYERLTLEEQRALSRRESPDFIGVEAGRATLVWLWEHQFAAIASDSPSWERAPIAGPHANVNEMVHQWCLAGWGMPIGELFDLERLSQQCKKTGRYTFFVSSMPLKVPGGVASPPNAVAVF